MRAAHILIKRGRKQLKIALMPKVGGSCRYLNERGDFFATVTAGFIERFILLD